MRPSFCTPRGEDGIHLLVYAIPHGIREKPRERIWPQHYRAFWYAEMADGTNYPILVDVETDEFERLPAVEGTPDERDIVSAGDEWHLPALVVLDDGWLIDGAHLLEAARRTFGEEGSVPGLRVPSLSDGELATIRANLRS